MPIWISKDPFYNYKVQFKIVEREVLSNEEQQALVEKEIDGNRLNVVRDMFVFCCYTGLSYIDVQKLNQDNIARHIDGGLWIQAERTKTKSKLGIPLLPTAEAILKKYKDHPKVINGKFVLPVLEQPEIQRISKRNCQPLPYKKESDHPFGSTYVCDYCNAIQWRTYRNRWQNVGTQKSAYYTALCKDY